MSDVTRRKRGAEPPPERKMKRVNDARNPWHNKVIHCSSMKGLFATECTIIGDNNHVIGSFNVLVGNNNTAAGAENVFRVPVVEPPRPPTPPPAPPPPPSAPALNPLQELLALFGEYASPPAQYSARAPDKPLVEARTDDNQWVELAIDLPGEPTTTTVEELQCIVCLDNKKDTLFRPCRHAVCCRACVRRTEVEALQHDRDLTCPSCRQPVESMAIFYI